MRLTDIDQAILGLQRIRARLYKVERATGRHKSAGRAAEIANGDDLSGWDVYMLDRADAAGVNLPAVVSRATEAVDTMLAKWS